MLLPLRSFLLCGLMGLCLVLGPAQHTLAAEKGAPGAKKVPTTIQSNRMEYDSTAQTVLFSGNVHVKRPDFELWAEKMTVYLEKSGANGVASEGVGSQGMEAGDIDRIVAEKKVRLKSADREGSCDKATYYAKEDKFVMEGSPRLWDNKQSSITGGLITHYLSTNKSEVQRNVGVTFYAPDKTDGPTIPLTDGLSQ